MSAVPASRLKAAVRTRRGSFDSGIPKSKHAAASASGGKKYHGRAPAAANHRKPRNNAMTATSVTLANNERLSSSFFASELFRHIESSARPTTMTASIFQTAVNGANGKP